LPIQPISEGPEKTNAPVRSGYVHFAVTENQTDAQHRMLERKADMQSIIGVYLDNCTRSQSNVSAELGAR
jgi:hypothetical protein